MICVVMIVFEYCRGDICHVMATRYSVITFKNMNPYHTIPCEVIRYHGTALMGSTAI